MKYFECYTCIKLRLTFEFLGQNKVLNAYNNQRLSTPLQKYKISSFYCFVSNAYYMHIYNVYNVYNIYIYIICKIYILYMISEWRKICRWDLPNVIAFKSCSTSEILWCVYVVFIFLEFHRKVIFMLTSLTKKINNLTQVTDNKTGTVHSVTKVDSMEEFSNLDKSLEDQSVIGMIKQHW